MEYNFDAGLTMPNQMADGRPYGCTGYTQTDCKTDQDKTLYNAGYTYEKTSYMEGHPADQGCDIRTSVKSLRVYGALPTTSKGDTSYLDIEAAKHKSGQSFNVDKAQGRDWFDSFRIALRRQKEQGTNDSISVGTIWAFGWSADGVIDTKDFIYSGRPFDYLWHNYKVCGEKTINGEPMLIIKAWLGKEVGDHGWLYIGRENWNKIFDIYGTIGLITAEAGPNDIYTIKLDMLQTVLVYLNRMLGLIGTKVRMNA